MIQKFRIQQSNRVILTYVVSQTVSAIRHTAVTGSRTPKTSERCAIVLALLNAGRHGQFPGIEGHFKFI